MCTADADRLDFPLALSGSRGEGGDDCVGVTGRSSDSSDEEDPDRSRGGAT